MKYDTSPTSRNDGILNPTQSDIYQAEPCALMEIRRALITDAEAISRLIKSVAHYFTLHPQGLGAEAFLQGVEPRALARCITAPSFSYFVGLVDARLAGVVALRDHNHLYHLFVAQPFQGRGLSRKLWEHAKETALAAGNQDGFTVNSTPYAVPIYQRFGFKATGPRTEANGISFVPMELRLQPQATRRK
jgi:GNAT superfamily N-acetyltransferase